jgi:hypothetical protein
VIRAAWGVAERKGFSVLLVRPFGLTGSNPFCCDSGCVGMAERKGFSVLLVRPFGLTGSNPFCCDSGCVGGGGEEGIRTPDTVSGIPDFESGAFSHSATSPEGCFFRGKVSLMVNPCPQWRRGAVCRCKTGCWLEAKSLRLALCPCVS